MKRRGIFAFVISLCMLALCCGAFFMQNKEVRGGDVSSQANEDSYIDIGEIWDGNKFNESTTGTLLQKLSGRDNIWPSDYTFIKNIVSSGNVTAQDIRDKNDGKDIRVTIGGFKWTPTYISKDKNDNVILTLWLDDSSELNGLKYDTSKTFNEEGNSSWNSGFSPSDVTDVPYPSAMYSTSYIRSVVLNNGGGYITSQGATSLTEYTPRDDSAFALFTTGGLKDFIVTPRDVAWQENQSAISTGGASGSYNYPNDAWSPDTPDDGFSSSGYNYAHKDHYDDWADDTLWLPSMAETGYSDSKSGLWKSSVTQRSNTTNSWLRSGCYRAASHAYHLYSSGSASTFYYVDYKYGVRPAFHLNLLKLTEYAPDIDELYENGHGFNEENVNKLLGYISGGDLTIDNVDGIKELVSTGNITASKMRNLNEGNDCLVVLGGLKWWVTYVSTDKNGNVIVTLWLREGSQLKGGKYDTKTFNDWGNAQWGLNSGGTATDNYPSNMYGTSYLHAAVLNNGGYYATDKNTLTKFTPTNDSIFAPFTIGQISRFIVTPRDVEWQEHQSAMELGTSGYQGKDSQNEGWEEAPDSNFDDENYTKKAHYSDWADDKLWIPSETECRSGRSNYIWQTSDQQNNTVDTCWLRTVRNNGIIGLVSGGGGTAGGLPATNSFSVRPALHLNLSKIASYYNSWDDHAATSFAGGDGSETNPYLIANAEQLALLAKRSRDASDPAFLAFKHFKLIANIDLAAYQWEGIGSMQESYINWFTGNIDGGNHEIRNMHSTSASGFINWSGNAASSSTAQANLKNLTFRDCEIISSAPYVGIAAGYYFIPKIDNVRVFDSYVEKVGTASYKSRTGVGAICGTARAAIEGCYVENTTVVGDVAGGICGIGYDNFLGLYNNCFVNGTVRGTEYAYGIGGVDDLWSFVQNNSVINATIIGGSSKVDLFTGVVTRKQPSGGSTTMNSNFGYGTVNGVETKLMVGGVDDWSQWTYIPSLNGDLPMQQLLFHVGGFSNSADIYNLLKRKGFIEETR